MLTDQDITKITARVESAFAPLRCVAEVWDYKEKLRFKIFDDEDNGIIEVPQIALRDVSDERHLDTMLQKTRGLVHAKGFVLS
jgi:hypothetical protein